MVAWRAAAVSLTLLLGSAACGSEPAPQAIPTTPEPKASSPSSSPSASAGTRAALTPPVLPVAAKSPDDAGQKAFVEHWIATYNYGQATGDTAPFLAVSDGSEQSVKGLAEDLEQTYRAGGRVEGAAFHLLDIVCVPLDSSGQTRPTITVQTDAGREIAADGKATTLDAGKPETFWVLLTYSDGAWSFDGLHTL